MVPKAVSIKPDLIGAPSSEKVSAVKIRCTLIFLISSGESSPNLILSIIFGRSDEVDN